MSVPVLLVAEDNKADQVLFQEGVKALGATVQLFFVADGVQALEFLRKEHPFQSAPRPNVVLLDFNMPRKDGREVLTEMKSDSALKDIPVLILSTSSNSTDAQALKASGASHYFTKPSDFDEYMTLISKAIGFATTTIRA